MLLATSQMALARTEVVSGVVPKFLQVSQLLVNHRLSPSVGGRIVDFAQTAYPDLELMLDRIIVIAGNSTRVEEFFGDIPEGELRDFAYWIIHSWYTGSSSMDRNATLFTYEEALMYQPTIDMVPIPTFGYAAPNSWGNTLYPLADLPQF